MNKKQRIVILLGVIGVILLALFPPRIANLRLLNQDVKLSKPIGHRFFTLTEPPRGCKFFGAEISGFDKIPCDIYTQMDTSRLYAELTILVVITAGLALAFCESRRSV